MSDVSRESGDERTLAYLYCKFGVIGHVCWAGSWCQVKFTDEAALCGAEAWYQELQVCW
ncbi:hypothetical protein [Anaplasma marginale]|uniref:hypothetical protein n=1 Tax=Anaplasma marginale TaxID=770 RepID=UPI00178328BD|nr:hypothetical protein [Anaplasma marginale]